jgi:hypothetical protein
MHEILDPEETHCDDDVHLHEDNCLLSHVPSQIF